MEHVLPNNIKGAIFDLDGTLLDSLGGWQDIDRRFFAKRGLTLPSDYMYAVNALEIYQTAVYTINRFGLKETPEQVIAEWNEMALDAYRSELKLKPNVKSYLNELTAAGVKLAVATSSTTDMVIPALKNNGVYDLFSTVITSSEVGKGKDSPDIFIAAAKAIGVTPDTCAVYEDSLRAIKTAKAAGFTVFGVYDEHAQGDIEQIKQIVDEFITFD